MNNLSQKQKNVIIAIGVIIGIFIIYKVYFSENIEYDDEALKAIAIAGEGSVRDIISIADSVIAYSIGKITLEGVQRVLDKVSGKTYLFINHVI